MQSSEVRAHLNALALAPSDAARLLGIGLRTVRRWTQPERLDEEAGMPAGDGEAAGSERVPGPAEQALRAWLKLQRLGQHWRPDGWPVLHVNTAEAIERVRARGGPATSWDIDVQIGQAVMNGHRLSFVWTGPGRFALQTYCHPKATPGETDATWAAIVDDACACIARRLAGERELPLLRLVLGEPVLLDELVELRDISLNPIVICRLPLSALRSFLERDVVGPEALSFVQRNQATLADLASEVHARRTDENAAPVGVRVLELHAGDLGLVRARLRSATISQRQAAQADEQRVRAA